MPSFDVPRPRPARLAGAWLPVVGLSVLLLLAADTTAPDAWSVPAGTVALTGLPLAVAHRGYSAIAPENTLPAIAAGMHSGAGFVETDVRFTADGVPVVIHDRTVDRTTDGIGEVAGMKLSDLRQLDAGGWFSPGFAGQRVPTLDEVLDLVRAGDARLLLEIKAPSTREQTAMVLAAIRSRAMADRVVVQSFDESIVRDCRDLAPEIRLGLLRDNVDPDPVAVARSLGVRFYNPSARSLLKRPDAVRELRAAGVQVMPWTVDDPLRWRSLTILGVAGVITNRPGELHGWRHTLTN